MKVLVISDDALRNRYGRYARERGIDPLDVKPGPMMMRDFACSSGAFPWSVYTKLIPRKLKKIEVEET